MEPIELRAEVPIERVCQVSDSARHPALHSQLESSPEPHLKSQSYAIVSKLAVHVNGSYIAFLWTAAVRLLHDTTAGMSGCVHNTWRHERRVERDAIPTKEWQTW